MNHRVHRESSQSILSHLRKNASNIVSVFTFSQAKRQYYKFYKFSQPDIFKSWIKSIRNKKDSSSEFVHEMREPVSIKTSRKVDHADSHSLEASHSQPFSTTLASTSKLFTAISTAIF
jgi:hypothetical protein